MNQPALAQALISHENYLAMELTSPVKHEYVDGAIYARPELAISTILSA